MNMREESKKHWASSNSTDHLRTGCLQRIADATELMAQNYRRLTDDLEMYKRWYEESKARSARLSRRNSALRGVITRMRRAK